MAKFDVCLAIMFLNSLLSLGLSIVAVMKNTGHVSGERRKIVVLYVFEPHKRRREILMPAKASAYVRPIREDDHSNLTRSVVQGRAWLQEILTGISIQSIASREHKSERMIRMMLTLAFLDPSSCELRFTAPCRTASARAG